MPDEQTKAPRTMSAEREEEINKLIADHRFLGRTPSEQVALEGLRAERDAERAVSDALLKALKECIDKAWTTPGEWVPIATMRNMKDAIALAETRHA